MLRLLKTCYSYVRRALFGEPKPRYPRNLGRFTINDARWNPLTDTFRSPMMAKLAESGITTPQRIKRLQFVPYVSPPRPKPSYRACRSTWVALRSHTST